MKFKIINQDFSIFIVIFFSFLFTCYQNWDFTHMSAVILGLICENLYKNKLNGEGQNLIKLFAPSFLCFVLTMFLNKYIFLTAISSFIIARGLRAIKAFE